MRTRVIRRSTTAIGAIVALVVLSSTAGGAPAIDQKEVCSNCHDMEDAFGARVKHDPVVEGQCTACHNPHVSRFSSLLLDQPGPMCGECHSDVLEALGRSNVHQPVAEGRCVDCHDAHGGQHANLLLRSGTDLCQECHDEVGQWKQRSFQHAPFDSGDCAECHDPHASDHTGLASRPGSEVCTTCHDFDLNLRSAHSGYPVDRVRCQECHDPHSSGSAGLLRRELHPPFADGACSDCHALPGSDEPFRTRQPLDRLCGECHEEQVTASREAVFPHVSAGGANCNDCHNAHTADDAPLLRKPERQLCLECHDPGGSKSEQEGRFLSHGDLDCSVCHSSHGAEQPLLLTASPIDLCGGCHSHQHTVAHPMGEESRDPRTRGEMHCLTCHGMHDAPHPKYMHKSGTRELCMGCHRDKTAGTP